MSAPLHVISGAGSGIGAALAKHAALHEGAVVAVLDRSAERVSETVEAIRAEADQAIGVVADVTDFEAITAAADSLTDEYGTPALVACNAGIEYTGALWEMDPDDWRRIQAVNVDGAFTLTRAFLPRMIESGRPGHLLYTASVGGVTITGNQAAYVTSKHAIRALAQSVARDLADRGHPIEVSILMPAAVDTPIFDDATSSGGPEAEAYRAQLTALLRETGQRPEEVARITYAAIRNHRRWIYPDPVRGEALLRGFVSELVGAFDLDE